MSIDDLVTKESRSKESFMEGRSKPNEVKLSGSRKNALQPSKLDKNLPPDSVSNFVPSKLKINDNKYSKLETLLEFSKPEYIDIYNKSTEKINI